MRLILALLAAAAAGALGAVILGEYPFKGVVVLASGLVFGLVIAEAALAVHRRQSLPLAAAVASTTIGLAAMAWAAWITTGHDLSYLGPAGWVAIPVTGAAAGLRTGGVRLRLRRGGDSPPATAPAAPSEGPPPSD